jgi:hypothetical protein
VPAAEGIVFTTFLIVVPNANAVSGVDLARRSTSSEKPSGIDSKSREKLTIINVNSPSLSEFLFTLLSQNSESSRISSLSLQNSASKNEAQDHLMMVIVSVVDCVHVLCSLHSQIVSESA